MDPRKIRLGEVVAPGIIFLFKVIAWQNQLIAYRDKDGKGYSPDYLRSVHAQLSAIFNHAVKYYRLPVNPARTAGTLGKEIPKEMDFWTKEEYLKFAEAVMDKPVSYYAFEMLYWTGIREGELLALAPADFDFEVQTVTISKTYHRMKGKDIITSPKTIKSNRTIKMPEFLCEEMQDYGLLYPGTFIFAGSPKVGKSFFMAQLAYHVAAGIPLREYPVRQGSVLYLALEDDYARLQKRLSRMFDVEGTDNLYLATDARSMTLAAGSLLVEL